MKFRAHCEASTKSKGSLIASLLYQAWRAEAPPPRISELELANITPMLLGSGAGALAWSRIRDTLLGQCDSAIELHRAFCLHALQASMFEGDIKKVIALLRSASVDAVLIKGLAIARLYPDAAMRPYGDIDLCVRQAEYGRAAEVCESSEGRRYVVDLHSGIDGLNLDELYARSQVVELENAELRVPCPEDHFRILSLHMLRHGAWRPIWLYDISLALETRPADFNWDLCLGPDRRQADWIACAIGLAHQLLGARIDDTPVTRRAQSLPSWLILSVLKQWEKPFATHHGVGRHRAPMATYLRRPIGMVTDLRSRWPRPIEATVYVRGPFNQLPRLPFQIAECVDRTAKFIARLPKALGKVYDLVDQKALGGDDVIDT